MLSVSVPAWARACSFAPAVVAVSVSVRGISGSDRDGLGVGLAAGKHNAPATTTAATVIGPAHCRIGYSPVGLKISARGQPRLTIISAP